MGFLLYFTASNILVLIQICALCIPFVLALLKLGHIEGSVKYKFPIFWLTTAVASFIFSFIDIGLSNIYSFILVVVMLHLTVRCLIENMINWISLFDHMPLNNQLSDIATCNKIGPTTIRFFFF